MRFGGGEFPTADRLDVALGWPDAVVAEFVSQEDDLLGEEGALRRGQSEPCVPVRCEDLPEVQDVLFHVVAVDQAVVEESDGDRGRYPP